MNSVRTTARSMPNFLRVVILSEARRRRAQSKDLRLLSGRQATSCKFAASLAVLLPAVLLALLFCAPLAAASADSATPVAQPTRADAEKDPVLNAMLAEMDRSMSQLQLKGFAKPFFIQYTIEEIDEFSTQATFGASQNSVHNHQRVARVTVRVGDYKTDSSNARGDGFLELASLDDDPIALRSSLWQATDQAYKNALAAYAQKQAELKEVQTPPQADDFSHEKPIVSLADPMAFAIDEPAWTSRVARASGLYRSDATVSAGQRDVEYSSASFRARAVTTRIVTSEGAIVRKSSRQLQESFAVGTQAADGMNIDRSYATTGTSLADLDAEDAFNRHAVDEIASLAVLRQAPLVEEEYHGPLLLSADAATDTLHSLLANAVVAARPPLGTEARTTGAFASSFHARVLPDFINVVDDPTLKSFNGKGLVGSYEVDDEAVPARPVSLVESGRLVNYLIGRQPVRDFPQSNGHGRASLAGAPRPAVGVLKISAENGLSMDELNQKLLDLVKDRGLHAAYYVETLGGERYPRLLYRIGSDGKRQLVRGAILDDLDQRALRSSIEAAGKDLWLANNFSDPPQTVLAPALLFNDATVRRANQKNEKLPFYPPPQ